MVTSKERGFGSAASILLLATGLCFPKHLSCILALCPDSQKRRNATHSYQGKFLWRQTQDLCDAHKHTCAGRRPDSRLGSLAAQVTFGLDHCTLEYRNNTRKKSCAPLQKSINIAASSEPCVRLSILSICRMITQNKGSCFLFIDTARAHFSRATIFLAYCWDTDTVSINTSRTCTGVLF